MARTAVTATSITKDAFVELTSAGTTIDATLVTNGVVILAPLDGRLIIEVTNTAASALDITIQGAPEYGTSGNFFDLVQEVAQNETFATTLENAKYVRGFNYQSDNTDNGYFYVDFETGFTGTLNVYALNAK